MINSKPNTIWKDISEFTNKMNQYFTSNRLKNNITKTKIMIVSEDKNVKLENICIDNVVIKNSNSLKILGTTYNDKLNWNNNFFGKEDFYSQLKKRKVL